MDSPKEILELVKQRLREANILLQNDEPDGAFYLAGYSVELMLKWKVCENFDIPNLYREKNEPKIEGVQKLKGATYTHDLYSLLLFSGLRKKFDKEKVSNTKLQKANSLLFSCWNEKVRYKPCGHKRTKNVEDLLSLLTDEKNGLIQWIKHS